MTIAACGKAAGSAPAICAVPDADCPDDISSVSPAPSATVTSPTVRSAWPLGVIRVTPVVWKKDVMPGGGVRPKPSNWDAM